VPDGVGDAVLVADAERRLVDANRAACALTGYTRAELLRMRVADLVARDASWGEAQSARFVRDGAWGEEADVRRKDGSTVRVEVRSTSADLPCGRFGVALVRGLHPPDRSDAERGDRPAGGRAPAAPDPPAHAAASAEVDWGPLTRREREVAVLIARGATNGRIAEALSLSEGTIANHVRRARLRLGFERRGQIAAWVSAGPARRLAAAAPLLAGP
jgi:PAS domain S-box-containing protein